MSDGSSSGDDVSINEGTIHVASAASSFIQTSLFPSNAIKLTHSLTQVYRRMSGIFRHYFVIFITTSVSLTILRVPNLSLLLILASINLGCVLFQFCSGLPL